METFIASLLVFIMVAYMAWISMRVARDPELERHQKASQIAVVWLAPMIGAVVVHLISRESWLSTKLEKSKQIEPQLDHGHDMPMSNHSNHFESHLDGDSH